MRRALAALALTALASCALAGGIELRSFANPAHAQLYETLIAELRCLVCQNQTLGESNADLARDMRAAIARMVEDGSDHAEVVAFMTERYGDFVRYRPPLKASTLALWIGPFALAAAALAFLPSLLRRQRRAALSDEQRKEAERMLAGE